MTEEAIFLNSGPLFSGERLERMEEDAAWEEEDQAARDAYMRIREAFEKHSTLLAGNPTLEETRFFMLNPAVQALGFTPSVYEPVDVGDGTTARVDYTLFANSQSFYDSVGHRGSVAFFRPALCIVKTVPWGYNVSDGELAQDIDDETENDYHAEIEPPTELDELLRACGTDFGIVSNGWNWRLYHRATSERLDTFFQADMIAAMKSDFEDFKRFYLLFRRDAFLKGREGISFLDSMLQ